jgi:quercetin dioxygenase-like cupin family protein
MSCYNLDAISERELYPGYFGQVIHTANMTFVYWRAEASACLPAHAHPPEQVVSMLEGQSELSIGGDESTVLGPGEIAVIPGNTEHAGRAVSACRFLDVCYPVREGYATGE